jgi:two-component system, OmpR family, response regulator RegX3
VIARVLVVDDEPALRDSVTYALEREGFAVSAVADGEAALELASKEPFDAVVLDVMLPGLPGTEVCRRLRRESSIPIVMLTAKTAELDRVVGLELGADDYVTKPFSLAELVARVRAILRRRELDRSEAEAPILVVGGIAIDRVRHEVRVDGRPVELTPSEFRLLALLASEPGRPFTRRELVQELWRSEYVGDERICDTHVVGLRRKVERDPGQPARILAVRGVGYKLVAA